MFKLTMTGRLSECLLLSYRTPAASIRRLLPPGLSLVTRGPWAFWNVVACRVDAMRPRGLAAALGISYHHVAYRLMARARTADGQAVEGLYFVRSDADSGAIACTGNRFTNFLFHRSEIGFERRPGRDDALTVSVLGRRGHYEADALLRVDTAPRDAAPSLSEGSPFTSPEEAARFLKYQPLGLSVDLDARWLKLAEVMRDEQAWRETPVRVIEAHWSFLDSIGQTDVQLERATRVEPLDYRWRLDRRLPLADGLPRGTSSVAQVV